MNWQPYTDAVSLVLAPGKKQCTDPVSLVSLVLAPGKKQCDCTFPACKDVPDSPLAGKSTALPYLWPAIPVF